MRGVSRMSFAELRDQLPEVLAEAGRSTGPRPGSASAHTTGAAVPERGPTSAAVPERGPTSAAVPERGPTSAAVPERGPTSAAVPEPGPTSAAVPEPGPTSAAVPEPGRTSAAAPEPGPTSAAAAPEPGRTGAAVPEPGPTSAAVPEPGPTGAAVPELRPTGAGRTGAARTGAARTGAARTGAAGPGTGTSLAATVGDELFAVLHLLDSEHGLRRALADPSKPADEKGAIMVALLHGKVTPATEELVAATVRAQWAGAADMTDALEQLAVEAFAIAAEESGQLDDLEDELFRFNRVVASEPELRAALSEPVLPAQGKQGLINALLADKVTPVTLRLITEMSLHPRGRPMVVSLDMCTRIAAERRQRLIAVVRTATGLSAEQRRRLADALAGIYGHEVYVNIVIDPKVMGGMTIQVGDELIDASVASRLAAVRRKLAG